MSRYTKQHYEDVAAILSRRLPQRFTVIAEDFADLFATDNPDYCGYCGTPKDKIEGPNCVERDQPLLGHSYVKGFDRDKFLTACGLEPM